jgi:hypothetical protein
MRALVDTDDYVKLEDVLKIRERKIEEHGAFGVVHSPVWSPDVLDAIRTTFPQLSSYDQLLPSDVKVFTTITKDHQFIRASSNWK